MRRVMITRNRDRDSPFGMSDFRKLRVWHAAQALVVDAYGVTKGMRGPQSASTADQLNRSTMSVPRNIIEGNAHESPRERARSATGVLILERFSLELPHSPKLMNLGYLSPEYENHGRVVHPDDDDHYCSDRSLIKRARIERLHVRPK
jgi:hypothetical protein